MDLCDDVHKWVDEFGDVILNSGAQHDSSLVWFQLLVALQPICQFCRGRLDGFGERVGNAKGHQVLVIFSARIAGVLAFDEFDR